MTYVARFVVAIACLSMVACTTLRPLALADADPHQTLGYMVRVGNPDGSYMNLKVVELRDGGFVGTRSAGRGATERVEIRYSEITSLERAEFSAWKTVGLFGLILVVLAAIAFSQDPLY